MSRLSFIAAAACLTCSLSAAHASDTALYAEAAPEDASFVRFVGFDGADTAFFANKTFTLPPEAHNAYIPVSSALLNGVDAGSFVTVVQQPNGAAAITEPTRDNKSKVFLFLVNATETALELRLADGSVPVIEDVSALTAAERAVNPVQIALGVFEVGAETPVATFDVTMKRGQNLTFLADARGVHLIENRFGAVAH